MTPIKINLQVIRTKAVKRKTLTETKRYNVYDFVLIAEGADEEDMDAFAVDLATVGDMAVDGHSSIDLHGHTDALEPRKGFLEGHLYWLPEHCPKVEEYAIRGIYGEALEDWRQGRGYTDIPASCEFTFDQ